MSIDLNWAALDGTIAASIKQLLNERLAQAALPSFLRTVEVRSIELGSVSPLITIKNIGDPFTEFYEDQGANGRVISPERRSRRSMSVSVSMDDLETSSSTSGGPPPYDQSQCIHPTNAGWEGLNLPFFQSAFATPGGIIMPASSGLATPRQPFGFQQFDPHPSTQSKPQASKPTTAADDIQIDVNVEYAGDITVEVSAELSINYPTENFITLPILIQMSALSIATTLVVAYIQGLVHVSLVAEESPLKSMHITSQIGATEVARIEDVEKVEKFMVNEIRSFIESELVFPSYVTVVL